MTSDLYNLVKKSGILAGVAMRLNKLRRRNGKIMLLNIHIVMLYNINFLFCIFLLIGKSNKIRHNNDNFWKVLPLNYFTFGSKCCILAQNFPASRANSVDSCTLDNYLFFRSQALLFCSSFVFYIKIYNFRYR